MSIHQTNKDKPRAQKCRHFCFSFDLHNYCPTCREAGKSDDPCVTFEVPCDICASFTDDQMNKIQHRKRYLKKQKADTNTKDDELDLLGEGEGDSFTGSNADLESAADNLFTSPPPRPQPLPFSSLSLKTPAKSVPPTPDTALQQKIETNLEKSLGHSLNIHLQQQMGSFQASMLEAFQSLGEVLTAKKQTEVDQSSVSASVGCTSTAVNLDLPPLRHRTNIQTEDMDVDLYSMANTGLLRRKAEMTLLQPQLGETRRQELRNSSFWDPSLFQSQLVKEGEDFLLKKGTSKDS